MVTTTRHRTRLPARRGFTLVEMIIVLGIILLLVSLSVGTIFKVINYQQTNNTRTLVSKLDAAFQKQWRSVVETAKNEAPNSWAMTQANNDLDLARVIHVKCRLRQEFPTSFDEARNPYPLAAKDSYKVALQNAQSGRTWQAESSACLYLALKEKRRSGDFDPDTALSAQEVYAAADGVKEIHDAWGNPVVFLRFPVVCQTMPLLMQTDVQGVQDTVNPSGTAQSTPPSHDPVDPDGLLANANWAPTATTFMQYMHPVVKNKNYNLAPVIMSMGSDGLIYDPSSPGSRKADDVYNVQLTPLNQ